MAFVPVNTNNTTSNTNTGNQANGVKEKRTTIAYVNHYLKLKDGTRIKMHSELTLRLYAEKRADVKLVELIKAGKMPTTFDNGFVVTEFSLARDENEDFEFDIPA